MRCTDDILWRDALAPALEEAAAKGLLVFVVTLGQGLGPAGDW